MSAKKEKSKKQPLSEEDLMELVEQFVECGATIKDLKGLNDETMEAIYALAYNLYNGGRYKESETLFQFLSFHDHLEPKYFMGLGAARQMNKKYESAVEAYGIAGFLNMEDPLPAFYAAECHLALGNLDLAESALIGTIEWAGDNKKYEGLKQQARIILASVREKLGNKKEKK